MTHPPADKPLPPLAPDSPVLPVWPVLGLVVLVLLAMGRVVTHEFSTWDDPSTLYRNPMFNPPKWGDILATWDPRNPQAGLWVPVTYTIWGLLAETAVLSQPDDLGARLNPAVFHGASLAVHLISSVLVYVLLRRVLAWSGIERRAGPAAWLGAAVFAVHPLQVESVGWTSGLKDLLWGLFALAAVLAYLAALDGHGQIRRNRWWWLGLGLFLLGTLAKPTAMVTPALALTVHVAVVLAPRVGWRAAAVGGLRGTWPWLACVPVVAAWTKWAQPGGGVPTLAPWLRPLIGTDALAFYTGKILLPINLAFDYGRHPNAIAESGALWWTWVVPAALAATVVWVWRRCGREGGGGGIVVAAAAWAVVAVSPVLGLTPFMFQYYSTVSDHYFYLSMVGVGMVVAWGMTRLPEGVWPTAKVVVGVVLVLLVARSAHQMGTWKDSYRLYERALAVNPKSFVSYTNLGGMALFRGDAIAGAPAAAIGAPEGRAEYKRALDFYDRAVAIRPDYSLAWDHRAVALFKLGDTEAGLASLLKSVEMSAKVPLSVRGPMIVTHLLLGQFFVERGQYGQALFHLEAAEAENQTFRRMPPEDLERLELLKRRARESLATP